MIGWVAGEKAGEIGAKRLRFIKPENQEHDSESQNRETDNVFHATPSSPRYWLALGCLPGFGGEVYLAE